MDLLPIDLENIINDYKFQLEHTEKFKKCMKEINDIERVIFPFMSIIKYKHIDFGYSFDKHNILYSYDSFKYHYPLY